MIQILVPLPLTLFPKSQITENLLLSPARPKILLKSPLRPKEFTLADFAQLTKRLPLHKHCGIYIVPVDC